jgi:tetratricopeptide (TPR) repeat protein
MAKNDSAAAEAEALRLAGNDAFMTQDWERAASLYLKSLAVDPASKNSAKVYSNLAQTFVKQGDYRRASEAAERTTSADPSWAKGWWRRATVATLNKDYLAALSHYTNALRLDGANKVFEKDLRKCAKIVGGTVTRQDDGSLLFQPKETSLNKVLKTMDEVTPGRKTWDRLFPDGFDIAREYAWRDGLDLANPTSEQ